MDGAGVAVVCSCGCVFAVDGVVVTADGVLSDGNFGGSCVGFGDVGAGDFGFEVDVLVG